MKTIAIFGGFSALLASTVAAVPVDPQALRPLWYASTEPRPNRVLLFSVAPELDAAALPPFVPNAESLERGVVYGVEGLEPLFAFPLHLRAARLWLEAEGLAGPHRYEVL